MEEEEEEDEEGGKEGRGVGGGERHSLKEDSRKMDLDSINENLGLLVKKFSKLLRIRNKNKRQQYNRIGWTRELVNPRVSFGRFFRMKQNWKHKRDWKMKNKKKKDQFT